MKTIEVEHTGGPEVLHMRDIGGLEPPGPGQALVRVLAAGVNFMDIGQRRGSYPRQVPFTPGMEGAGVIESIGDDSSVVAPSSRVAFVDQPGAYAEASLVSADRLIPLPDDFTFEEGAAFPMQGITAHYLIHEFRKPVRGDVVLIHAAAGGVGQMLVQWAHHLGAFVIGTVSCEEKAQVVRQDGANEVIIYTKKDFAREVNRLTNYHGADLILDGVGKATFRKNLEAVAVGGHIVIFGASSGPSDKIDPNELKAKSISISEGRLSKFIGTRQELLRRANDVMEAMRQGWLKLHIDCVLPLDRADEAHRLLESRKTTGKIILVNTAGEDSSTV
ncbi:MAG TPA: quinone oxidoreductase [Candidatus Saccharimonadales bacterium]|jgi:NADPH2:quinone reductase|nr:quinone oxidoreductase [Candidatus Saccharimonadales bacterium]